MEELSNLPVPALFAFGAVLAIIFAVRYLGLWQVSKAPPSSSPASAQVAAVIVDPTALNRASSSVEKLTEAIIKASAIARTHNSQTAALARATHELSDKVDKLQDELIRSAASIRRSD